MLSCVAEKNTYKQYYIISIYLTKSSKAFHFIEVNARMNVKLTT